MTDETHCECGRDLATHPPLPRPGPLRSWKSQRAVELIGSVGTGHTGRVWTQPQIVACQRRAGQRYAASKAMRVRP